MTTVALVSHSPKLAGAERMLLNLSLMLHEGSDNINPVLLIPGDDELSDLARKYRLRFRIIRPSPWYIYHDAADPEYRPELLRTWNLMKSYFSEMVADLVVVNTLTQVAPTLAAIEIGLPIIQWVHGVIDATMIPNIDTYFSYVHDDFLLSASTEIIYNSNWTARHYRSFRGVPGGTVIHNWIPTEFFSNPTVNRQSGNRIVCLNTFDETKGHSTLLKAAAAMKNKSLDFHLDFHGDGSRKKEMQALSHALDLDQYVSFKNRTTNVANVYDEALCLVNPSHVDSFGLTLVEAMARKIPVVATRSGGPEEIVEDGETGYLVDPGDHRELADRLELLLNDNKQARRLGEAGYAHVRANFNEDAAALKFVKLLEIAATKTNLDKRNRSLLLEVYRLFVISGTREGFPYEDHENDLQSHIVTTNAVPQGYARIRKRIRYRLTPKTDGWMGLDVLLRIMNGPYLKDIELSISTASGHLLRQSRAPMKDISEEGWASFSFDPINLSSQQEFRLDFTLSGPSSEAIVIMREASPQERLHMRILRRLGFRFEGNILCAREYYAP